MVFHARTDDGREAAVKVLHPSKIHTEEMARFRREYEALKELNHPNIVKVLDSGRHEGYPWLAMELVEGTDLGALVESWSQRPPIGKWKEIERIFRVLCDAIGYMHDMGLIHRDLKPSNILVSRDGKVKITDFGGVKGIEGHSTQLTEVGRLVGTIAFMAPEQITGEKGDIRQDLYSLGAILFVMLTGRPPIESTTIAGYLSRHLTMTPPAPSTVDPSVPQSLERVCLALLQKDPVRRPATALKALELLESKELLTQMSIHGREELLQTLVRRSLIDGSPGIIALVGKEGSGRTALLNELAARLGGREIPVYRDLESLETRLGGSDGPRGRSRSTGERTCIAILDTDARRVDEPRLGRLLLRRQDEILLFTAALPEEVSSRAFLGESSDRLYPECRVIESLPREAVVAMLKDRGLPTRIAETLGQRLHQELWGHPGDIIEQFETLLSVGWLVPGSDRNLKAKATIDQLREAMLPVPERARKEDLRRVRALGEDPRAVIEALAVIDDDATPRLLELVTTLPSGPLQQAIESLAADTLIRLREEGLDQVCRLAGGRVRQVVYEQLEDDSRQELHLAVAAALGSIHRRRRQVSSVIANHLWRGGKPQDAWPLLVNAAWDAWTHKDEKLARSLLSQNRKCRVEAEPRSDDLTRAQLVARMLVLEGEMALARQDIEAESSFMEAVRMARQGSDADVLGQALSGLGRSLLLRGDLEGALDTLEEALTLASRSSARWSIVGNALATTRFLLQDASGAHALYHEVAELALDSGDRVASGLALTGQALSELAEGQERLSGITFEKAESALRAARDREALLRLLRWQGLLALAAGRYRETMDRMWEAEQIAKAAGLPAELARVQGIRAEALLRIGLPEEARSVGLRSLEALDTALPLDLDGFDDDLTEAESRRRHRERIACHALARVHLELEFFDKVLHFFPEPDGTETPDRECTSLLMLGVRARAMAVRDPSAAIVLSERVMNWNLGALSFILAQAETDASLAFTTADARDKALQAATRAAIRVQGSSWAGVKLDAALALFRCGGQGQRGKMLRIVDEVRNLLPLDDQVTFLQRPEIREMMGEDPGTR